MPKSLEILEVSKDVVKNVLHEKEFCLASVLGVKDSLQFSPILMLLITYKK